MVVSSLSIRLNVILTIYRWLFHHCPFGWTWYSVVSSLSIRLNVITIHIQPYSQSVHSLVLSLWKPVGIVFQSNIPRIRDELHGLYVKYHMMSYTIEYLSWGELAAWHDRWLIKECNEQNALLMTLSSWHPQHADWHHNIVQLLVGCDKTWAKQTTLYI